MHDTDVTIYNRIKSTAYEHDSYIPTVLHNTSVKYEYAAMIDHTGIFTLDKGDFFVIGDVKEESGMVDFLSYMKEKYDSVHEILSVATYNLIPHWEVTAK